MEAITSVRGLASHVFEWLDPEDKKSLSQTCRAFRSLYLENYFPCGLRPVGMRLEVASLAPQKKAAPACVCGRPSSPTARILGIKRPGCVGMISHCGKARCREKTVKRSLDMAIRSLLLDMGDGVYLPRPMYYSFMERIGEKNVHAKYSRMKYVHDSIVVTMMKHCLGRKNDEECDAGASLHSILDSRYATIDEMMRGSGKKQIIYVPLKDELSMFTITPPKDQDQTRAYEPGCPCSKRTKICLEPTPAWNFTYPSITPCSTPTLQSDGPVPMEY